MKVKLSPFAVELLICIYDHCGEPDSFWVPPGGYKISWLPTLNRSLFPGCYQGGFTPHFVQLENQA